MGTDKKTNTERTLWDQEPRVEYDGCKSHHFKLDMPSDDKYIHEAIESDKGSYSNKYTAQLSQENIDSKFCFTILTEYVEE